MPEVASVKPQLPHAPLQAGTMTPFWLPASHFTAGLLFFVSAAVLLPFVASDMVSGRFLLPRIVALVHLITLGWLSVSIMGALCQLFPVALSTPLRWPKLSAITLALFAPGLLLFVIGMLLTRSGLIVAGAALFGAALLLFIVNAYGTLLRAPRRELTWWTLALGFFFLLATVAFGGSLAGNYRWSYLGDRRLAALALHMHVAMGGWVLLIVMAVGRRLLPMFLLSHRAHEAPVKVAITSMSAGALLLTLLHGFMTRSVFVVATLLMGVAVVALITQVALYVRARHRPQLDAGLRLVVAAGVLMLIAVGLGLAVLLTRAPLQLVSAYGIAAVGSLTLFVAGHYYKILPFLVWNHRFAPLVGKRPLPRIVELYNARVAGLAALGLAAGLYGLVIAALFDAPVPATVAAIAFTLGAVTEAGQLLRLLRTRVA
ncbi:MAG TPA: hypothetical protein VF021_12900 [Longimicrobiales bacterium]